MHRPRLVGNGLARLLAKPSTPSAAAFSRSPRGTRTIVTGADVDKARHYCLRQVQHGDYDAYLIQRFVPPRVQDAYLALRALNLELVRLPEVVSNPTIGHMRMQFWRESIDKTFSPTASPPAEPICVLLHKAVADLRARATEAGGSSASAASSMKFWVQRVVRTREKHMENRPFATLTALEDYAENTYATLMYALLAAMPLQNVHVDHLASHIGKAVGITAVLRGIPVLAAPQPPVRAPDGSNTEVGRRRDPVLLLPLDVMADAGVREEDFYRQGPGAAGFQDAVFAVATRANDHLITAREMLKNLRAGRDPGHEFEHQGEDGHVYEEHLGGGGGGDSAGADAERDIRRAFGVFLEAVPAQEYLRTLESHNFDPFLVRSSWKLPWRVWQALRKQQV